MGFWLCVQTGLDSSSGNVQLKPKFCTTYMLMLQPSCSPDVAYLASSLLIIIARGCCFQFSNCSCCQDALQRSFATQAKCRLASGLTRSCLHWISKIDFPCRHISCVHSSSQTHPPCTPTPEGLHQRKPCLWPCPCPDSCWSSPSSLL